MPAGFRVDTDNWLKEYEEAKQLAQEVVQLIQDRNVNHPTAGPEASRMTAMARRKIGTLGTQLDKLAKSVDSSETADISEPERNRRRDLVNELKNRREQMQFALKRNPNERNTLFEGSSSSTFQPRETDQTAELDNRGLLQLQTKIMHKQDEELEDMEKVVVSIKHIGRTIGEEVDLHTRLLDDLEEDVDVTHSRLRAATQKVKYILKHSSHWKGGLCIFLLIVGLVVTVILALKIHRLFI